MRTFQSDKMLWLVVSLFVAACGHGSGAPAPQTPAPAQAVKPAVVDPKSQVLRIIWEESQGEKLDEIKASVHAPLNYGFSSPLKSLVINYFYGPRIFNSLTKSRAIENHASTTPVALLHAADRPLSLLTQPEGRYRWEFHGGIDLQAKEGTPVYAPADAVVFSAGYRACVGETVVLRHEVRSTQRVVYSIYSHLQPGSFANLKMGDRVLKGALVAKVGQSGEKPCVEGSHLHFEIRTPREGLDVTAETVDNWHVFLRQTARQNPADYIREFDLACQNRKRAEINNAIALIRQEPGSVAPLSAGRCSLSFESRLGVVPRIYHVYDKSQLASLGLP